MRSDGTRRYYHPDSLGSSRVVTDDAGAVVSASNYDAYGAVRASAGEGRSFTYTGEQTDESGLEFLRARYYDPPTGRFLQKDSLAVLNRYSYGNGNPLRYTDPSGHFPWLLAVVLFSGALSAFDIGSSVHTATFDANATPEQRDEARANFGTYVTAAQIDGPAPVGDLFGIALGAARGGRKTIASAVRYADEVLQRGVPIGTGAGQWVRNAPSMSEEAKLYQEYVTGAPYGFEFLRNGVHFDGVRLTEGGELLLLDAKCASSAEKSLYSGVNDPKKPFAEQSVLAEARRRLKAADGIRIEWHVSDPSVAETLGEFLARNRIPIDVVHTTWTP